MMIQDTEPEEERGPGQRLAVDIVDGQVTIQVKELLIWSKVSSGDYNKNQAYAHLLVTPAAPWLVKVNVGNLEGLPALSQVIEAVQNTVHKVVREKAKALEKEDIEDNKRTVAGKMTRSGVEVATTIQTLDGIPVRPVMMAVTGPDPEQDDF